MTDDRNDYDTESAGRGKPNSDEVWPGIVHWDLGAARGYAGEMVWRCDASRAGKLYSRSLFSSQEEAREFVARMREREPDQMFSVEAIKTSAMWN